jgi:RNA-directed DNA polymerase
MKGTSSPENISTRLERIAMLAKKAPDMKLQTLAHHIDVDFLREAYRRTRKSGAAGVDGISPEEYEANLEDNLRSLLGRAKSGTYRAPPVRRVHIPKGNGETRPLGIPTLEDKVLQRAVAMILSAVYEQSFLDCSYGFRPGRSAHQLLQKLWETTTMVKGGWVIEVDIRKYFDTIPHGSMREILSSRVADGVLLRLIGKWLNAGVLEEDGAITRPGEGTPQGGVISPLLANIYLHTVLDEWFHREVIHRLDGQAWLFRYADDAVLVFAKEQDARRVFDTLPKRFERFGLKLHPEKTRLVKFQRPDQDDEGGRGGGRLVFDLLGFTHYWGTSRSGKWTIKRKTAKDRFRRTLTRIVNWCRGHRHDAVRVQQQVLTRKLEGHYGYFGINGNSRALNQLRREVIRAWCKWLSRRSQRARITWDRMNELLKRLPLPQPRIRRPLFSRSANP